MKKIVLGALLAGCFASGSASAEIRSFDFTANVSSLASAATPSATSVEGIVAGTTIALGDVIKGTVSFDDAGITWGAGSFSGFRPASLFTYTFEANGTRVDIAPAQWAYTPNFLGGGGSLDMVNVVGASTDGRVSSNLTLFTPHDAFSWTLGGATSASLAVSWASEASGTLGLSASLSDLVEVTPVPEPASYAMLLLGALVVGGVARRRAPAQG